MPRLNTRNVFWIAVLGLAIAATAYAVSFGTLPPADYTFVNSTEIKSVDPANVTGVPEGRIVLALFEGLTTWDPRDLRPLPGVAERWTLSDDKRIYTFHLRDNAVWTDGTPVTAEDFVWSWRRVLHPATAAEYAYEMWYIENAEKFSKSQLAAGDAVEIELNEREPDARPFAAGRIVRGKLLAIEESQTAAGKIYFVEIDGRERRFQKDGINGESYAWLLPDFDSVGIKALDPRTLEVRLNHPVPYLLDLTGYYFYAPVNRKCVESYAGQDWIKPHNIVTNGAFTLQFRRLRDRIRLLKSESYWDRDNIHLNVVDALAAESQTTAFNLYLTGQVDWFDQVPSTVVPELLRQNRPDFQPAPYIGTYYYRLNVTREALSDVRVRQALAMSINKTDIVENIARAGQTVATSFVPPLVSQYSPYRPAPCPGYNVDRARELLAEAGYPEGRDFPTITIQYNTHEMHKPIAELLQHQWKQSLGIDVKIQNQEWQAYQANQRELKYDVSRAAWIGDYPDANTFLSMFVTGGGNNQTGWSNTKYDQLIRKAQFEPDEQQRANYFQQAEAILMDELPVIPVFFYVTTSMARTYLQGYYPNYHDFHPLKGMKIDQEEKRRVLENPILYRGGR